MEIDYKEWARAMFYRRGGTRRKHGRQACHGHTGSGCNSKSSPGWDKMELDEHVKYIERQAAGQDALFLKE